MRVVLDTSVLVAGVRSARGASRRLLLGVRDRRFRPIVSAPLVVEYEAVLLRPEHLAAAGATTEEMLALIDDVLAVAEAVDRYHLVRPSFSTRRTTTRSRRRSTGGRTCSSRSTSPTSPRRRSSTGCAS